MFSISFNESLDQGFQGRFGRPREVFFFATPSTHPEAATGRAWRSGDRLEVAPLVVAVGVAELRSAERGVLILPSLDVVADFRLRFR